MAFKNPKLTSRQERFVALVIGGDSGQAAYQKAFKCAPKSAEANATRLMRNDGVAAAIAKGRQAITAAVVSREIITRDEILRRLRAIGLAEVTGGIPPGYSAQVRALSAAADLLGLRVEDAPHPDRPINEMTRAQRQARLAELRAKEKS